MAFLGSLGKALGLDSEFGKGLIAGTAEGFETGFADDIKRSKDNVDNLLAMSYKGAVADKKRRDKELKANKEIIDEIVGNLSVSQSKDKQSVLEATRSLIDKYNLKGALQYSQNLKTQWSKTNRDPFDAIEIGERTNHSTPLSSELLSESITDPITIPDIQQMAKNANVGIMKVFGSSDDKVERIGNRAKDMIKAYGIDINANNLDLPPAAKVNISPLIMGTLDNPVHEIIRIQNYLEVNKDTITPRDEKLALSMIDAQRAIIDTDRKIRETRIAKPLDKSEYKAFRGQVLELMGNKLNFEVAYDPNKKRYVTLGLQDKKRQVVTKYVNDLMDKLDDAAKVGAIGKQNAMKVIQESIFGDQSLTLIDGVLSTDSSTKLFSDADARILGISNRPLVVTNQPNVVTTNPDEQKMKLIRKAKESGVRTRAGTLAIDELTLLLVKERQNQGNPYENQEQARRDAIVLIQNAIMGSTPRG